jgi:hypothetical protein
MEFLGETFIGRTTLAIYTGAVIFFMTVARFGIAEIETRHFHSVAFTSLVLTELELITREINRPNCLSIAMESFLPTFCLWVMATIRNAFDWYFILSFAVA